MVKLSELIFDESDASDEAKRLGLDYLRFGRYGKDGKVTHVSKNGKLVPADQKAGEPHPSHGAAVRNVSRGRPAGEMPEPEYPIKYKQGAGNDSPVGKPSTPEDPNASLRATPLKKIPAGDYGANVDRPQTPQVDPFGEDGYVQAMDTLGAGLPSDKFASFIKPYLYNPEAAKSFFSKMIDQATDGDPDPEGYGDSSSHNVLMGAGMAMKVLRRLEDLKGPNVNSLSSMVPNKTSDQLNDPEDFEKNRNLDNIENSDEPFRHPDDDAYDNIMNSPAAKLKRQQNFLRKK